MPYPIHDEIVWAAGFFDGEGSISLSKRAKPNASGNHTYLLVVSIAQKDETILSWFQERWGGYISRHPHSSSLQLAGTNLARFLGDVIPYLRTRRRDQAGAALEYRQHLQPRKRLSEEGVALREHFRALINVGTRSQKRTHQLAGG